MSMRLLKKSHPRVCGKGGGPFSKNVTPGSHPRVCGGRGEMRLPDPDHRIVIPACAGTWLGGLAGVDREDREILKTGYRAEAEALRILRPSVRKISSKSLTNWLARSRRSARVWVKRSG